MPNPKYQNTNKPNPLSSPNSNFPISKNSFTFLYIIGKGGFGRVWKVEQKKNSKRICLKRNVKIKSFRQKK